MPNEWYKIQFQEKLDKLISLRGKATGDQLDRIDETIDVIESLIYCDTEFSVAKQKGIYARLDYETKEMEKNRDFWHLLDSMKKAALIPNNKIYIPFPKLTDDDLFGLINDIVKTSTNPTIYAHFSRMFKRRASLVHMQNLREDDLLGEAIFLSYFREVHIRMKRKRTIDDVMTLSHEYGHGIQFLTNYNSNLLSEHSLFSEIVSTFFELLALDYMREIKEFKRAVRQYEKYTFNAMKRKSEIFDVETRILARWRELKQDVYTDPIRDLTRRLEDYEDDCDMDLFHYNIKGLLDMHMSDYHKYIVAYLIAIEIFMVYLNDKDKGLWLLDRIMKIDLKMPREEYFGRILDLDIHPNENLENYRRHIAS